MLTSTLALVYRLTLNMQASYPTKFPAIRSKRKRALLANNFSLPLAATISLEVGQKVRWQLLDRSELHLVNAHVQAPQA